jgi:hypothetical protein
VEGENIGSPKRRSFSILVLFCFTLWTYILCTRVLPLVICLPVTHPEFQLTLRFMSSFSNKYFALSVYFPYFQRKFGYFSMHWINTTEFVISVSIINAKVPLKYINEFFIFKARWQQGCQFFYDTISQNGGNSTKLPLNYQITIRCNKL